MANSAHSALAAWPTSALPSACGLRPSSVEQASLGLACKDFAIHTMTVYGKQEGILFHQMYAKTKTKQSHNFVINQKDGNRRCTPW